MGTWCSVRDHHGGRLGYSGRGRFRQVALHFRDHNRVLGQRLHLLLFRQREYAGHGLPRLPVGDPGKLFPEQGVRHFLVFADSDRRGGVTGGILRPGGFGG